MNSNPANKVTEEQKTALFTLSKVAYDATVAQQGEVVAKIPALTSSLSQKAHPQSLCGCGCQEYVCGYFCISTVGCGCSLSIHVSSSHGSIGPTPNNGMPVHFNGNVNGQINSALNLQNVYMSGVFPDVESVVGHPLNFELSVSPNSVVMTFYEFGRPLGVMNSLPGYYTNSYFHGSGVGTFTQA